MRDPKTDLQPAHHINFAIHNGAVAGATVDMARHDYCLFSVAVFSIASANATIRLQHSDDNVSWSNVPGTAFSEPIDAAPATTRFLFVRERDVRRYVRVYVSPNGGFASLAVSSVMLNATQPPTGGTYAIDTSTL